jgi:hypothetical protein
MKLILEERGINTTHMVADDMLSNHEDFKSEKTIVENTAKKMVLMFLSCRSSTVNSTQLNVFGGKPKFIPECTQIFLFPDSDQL